MSNKTVRPIDRDETGFVVRGDTYPLRHTLRALGLTWDGSTGTYFTEDREKWEHAVEVLGVTPEDHALGVTVTIASDPPHKVVPVGYVDVEDEKRATHVMCGGCYSMARRSRYRARGIQHSYCNGPSLYYLREDDGDESFHIQKIRAEN